MYNNLEEMIGDGLDYEDMMELCREETKKRIDETLKLCLPFSETPEGRILLQEQLYGVLIQMLTYIQINARRLRNQRQREGIDSAMARGVRFGRRQKYNAEDYIDVFKRLETREIDKATAMAEIGSSYNTFIRMYKELKSTGKI